MTRFGPSEVSAQVKPRLAAASGRLREARPDVLGEEPLASLANLLLAGFIAGRVVRRIVR